MNEYNGTLPATLLGETKMGYDELDSREGFSAAEYEAWLDKNDGQPSEYEEWQDFMGGDDWDHGQYDEY
jgi:hypothetical protein